MIARDKITQRYLTLIVASLLTSSTSTMAESENPEKVDKLFAKQDADSIGIISKNEIQSLKKYTIPSET